MISKLMSGGATIHSFAPHLSIPDLARPPFNTHTCTRTLILTLLCSSFPRTLCDNLRRERDRAVSDLADALRNLDDMRKQKNDASRELKELK